MGFGHRDEQDFDGVMRMAFCVDGDHERHVGVEARQEQDRLALRIRPASGAPDLTGDEVATAAAQVARIVSLDHDGAAFDRICTADPAIAPVHAVAPGFRPALFYSPYEALVWSRPQRAPGPGRKGSGCAGGSPRSTESASTSAGCRSRPCPRPRLCSGWSPCPVCRPTGCLDCTRSPRPRRPDGWVRSGCGSWRPRSDGAAAAVAGASGRSTAPWWSSGPAATPTSCRPRKVTAVRRSPSSTVSTTPPDDAELANIADRWRPFRTWVLVMLRALGGRTAPG